MENLSKAGMAPPPPPPAKTKIPDIEDAVWVGFFSSLPVFDYAGLPRYTGPRLRGFRNVVLGNGSAASESVDPRVMGGKLLLSQRRPHSMAFWALVREEMMGSGGCSGSRDFDVQAVWNVVGYYVTAFRKGVDGSAAAITASVPGGASVYVLLAEWIQMIGGPPYTLTFRAGAGGQITTGAPPIQEKEIERKRRFWEFRTRDEEEDVDELAAARKKIEQLEQRLVEQRDHARQELRILRNQHGLCRANAQSELRSARAELEKLRDIAPPRSVREDTKPHFTVM
ncbi:hypothetical protein F4775DRAFT_605384 [Biscogniauxia sp. FL1348]|nr:hypothetical protein F4775DRAFT_605384 [Biscogniauxia sp. FL1348]